MWIGIKILNRSRKKQIIKRFNDMYHNKEIYNYLANKSVGNFADLAYYMI